MANSHSWNVELVAEKWRVRTYVAFWFVVLFANVVTKFFVAPKLKAGPPADTPANRMACGPFYFFDRTDLPGYKPDGKGFDFYETNHLTMFFGYPNTCTAWDYSPSRELTAAIYPIMEYSFMLYIFLDYVTIYLANLRGSIAPWFFRLSQWFFWINMIMVTEFRMVFVVLAYEKVNYHTAGFLCLQIGLMLIAIQNFLYVVCSKQNLICSVKATKQIAITYIVCNIIISAFKIAGTIHIVLEGEGAGWTLVDVTPDLKVGRVVDLIWMAFNAVIPLIIALFRNKAEDKLRIAITSETDDGVTDESETLSLNKKGASGYESIDPL